MQVNKQPSATKREHKRLLALWATGRATKQQIMRCTALDRKAARRSVEG